MRRLWIAGSLALLVAAADVAGAADRRFVTSACRVPTARGVVAQPVVAPAGPLVTRDRRANAIFSLSLTRDRQAWLKGATAGLRFEKTVTERGFFALALDAQGDRVDIGGNETTITVSRGGRIAEIDMRSPDEEAYRAIREVLIGSRAVRAFRVMASGLEPSTEETAAGAAVLAADAMVGMLDGDVAALDRYGRQIAEKARRRLRQVREEGPGCYEVYEAEVIRAWDDMQQCYYDVWYIPFVRDWCSYRWGLWVESAWFSFLACTILPFLTLE
jgi:hypothetical protein